MLTLCQDLRYGARLLRKSPGFTSVALLSLALGIGANTAIFTLVNAVLLKSLPVSKPEQLVLFSDAPGEGMSVGSPATDQWVRYSYPSYRYLRDRNDVFESLSAFRSGEARLSVQSGGEAAERAQGHLVSGNYFAALGANPLMGRTLTPDDDRPAASPATVVSYGYWKQHLNSDPSAVGRNVLLNGTSFTIVGVMPPEFFGIRVRRSPDYWLPVAFQPQIEMRESSLEDQRTYWLGLVGRLKPGVTIEQAQTGMNVLLHQFLTEQAGSSVTDERRKEIEGSFITLTSGARGISGLRFRYSEPLRMLMAIVGLVLLIACANVGNLLLSRSAARQMEISMRLALGANRGRLVRQLLTESVLLAVLGGAFGVLLAQWGVSALVTLVARTSPIDVRPDWLVLGFTVGVSLLAGILFGLTPALRASRSDLTTALKEKSARGTGGKLRMGLAPALIVSQVALSLVLLVGAGLFARSLLKLAHENLGFNRDNVLLVDVDPRLAGYKPAELIPRYRQLLERVGSLPGVQAATLATYSPISGTRRSSDVTVQGYIPQSEAEDLIVSDMMVGPSYCETLGLPVLLGREIGPQDTESSPKVAVVNQAFAEYFFHGENPIGRRFGFGDEPKDSAEVEIVGVIGDAKYEDAREKPLRTVYRPILQVKDYSANLEIRTQGDPLSMTSTVRSAIAQLDDKLPIVGVNSLEKQFADSLQQERLIAQLVSFFGLLALILACIGLYGVMANTVMRRTNEIGIRMALGAERARILWMVLRETLVLVFIGIAIGIPGAIVAARLVSTQLYGLTAADPLTLFAAAVVLIAVAALAGYLPARRASRVDPIVALRYE
ncbi:MAG TPA: ABC transporter permease [Blastocatellia bacterium]|nr:ABC transporter permease [Blastocatellia bacterium]